MNVLSVDDSPTVRHFIKSAVDLLGYSFYEAGDGVKGIEIVQNTREIDLILLDWNMPVMNGLTMLKELKKHSEYKKIPVTMVTTETERCKMITAIEEGAKNYIVKPFTQEELISKMMDSLGLGI
ncbi:response regulator [Chitinispirillales bacterium ANBcel5]|uniref:response regulator n=1 Tax=Cellulosispirillum alkaliphilum TaxID=3039283 RepID=UPI002A591E84|nr:response regulator [Chitinispirillales bacterium ANBcel5]